jgi:hypothetical protein
MPDSLKLLIRSGNPILSIQSTDEPRALARVREVAQAMSRPIMEWSMTEGLVPIDARGIRRTAVVEGPSATEALEHVKECIGPHVFVFKDLGPHGKDAKVYRLLRDLVKICEEGRSTIVLIDALPLPDEIRRLTVRYDIPWPDVNELEQTVRETYRRIRAEVLEEVSSQLTARQLEHLVQSLRGLTLAEAERVIASAIHDDYRLDADDLPRVIEAKRTILGSAGCLESIAVDFDVEDVGGLANLKAWLKQRRGGFSRQAREFGLEPPRGVLMLGVPGCGKSLCAKAVAADWHMPLLRLDPGVLYQKFIGESESQLRQALAQAEAMAPVVLWIDEIEKAFASASAGSADGGLSQRMFGTLLSWMQDHRHPICIIATANDISSLPPELMRKGRFDEVFFIDLPTQQAREQILGIHLTRKQRDPSHFDLKQLAKAAADFTGAELEQVVISALFNAFQKQQELADAHILEEIQKTRPLAVLNAEQIRDLRNWAADRCVSAD